jgi:hypothetical protein
MKREVANDKSVSEGKFLCFVAEKKRDEPELVDVGIKEAANNTVVQSRISLKFKRSTKRLFLDSFM